MAIWRDNYDDTAGLDLLSHTPTGQAGSWLQINASGAGAVISTAGGGNSLDIVGSALSAQSHYYTSTNIGHSGNAQWCEHKYIADPQTGDVSYYVLICRLDRTSGNKCYGAYLSGSAGSRKWGVVVYNSDFSSLKVGTTNAAANDVVALELSGLQSAAIAKIYVNGVLEVDTTTTPGPDSTFGTLYTGMGFAAINGHDRANALDNFRADAGTYPGLAFLFRRAGLTGGMQNLSGGMRG